MENFGITPAPIHICMVGIGKGGCKTLTYFVETKIRGVKAIAVDTDSQTLIEANAHERLLIGDTLLHGQSARGNDDLGRIAAEESLNSLEKIFQGNDIVFIAAGLGGGTGTGAAPLIAATARKQGALTIGMVTLPFSFEGNTRMEIAKSSLERLETNLDALIVVPADELVGKGSEKLSAEDSFGVFATGVSQSIKGMSELVLTPGLINLDFSDLRAVIACGASASISFSITSSVRIGLSSRLVNGDLATRDVMKNMLGTLKLEEAKGVLFSVTGGSDLSLFEVNQVASLLRDRCIPNVKMIFGVIINSAREDIGVRLFAFGDGINKRLENDETSKSFNKIGKMQQPSISSLKVFLCHSSNDKPVVRKLYQRLYSRQGIDPWLDEARLLPGEQWDIEITKAVKQSDAVIVCISKDSVGKEGYMQKEIKRALDIADGKPEGTIFIIPLKLEECEMPDRLSQWQWVNYYEDGAFERVMMSLRKRAQALKIHIE